MTARLVIFDLDGTLVDSEARIVAAMRSAFGELGLTLPGAATVREVIGLDLGRAIARIARDPLPEDLCTRLANAYRAHFARGGATPAPLFPQVDTTLAELAAERRLLAIATGKGRRGLDAALRETGIAHFFAASRCADDCPAKPHPAMLTELLDELAVAPGEALMVGDTEYDLAMAEAAGVAAVGVSYGAHGRARLLDCGPVAVIDALGELPAVLARLAPYSGAAERV